MPSVHAQVLPQDCGRENPEQSRVIKPSNIFSGLFRCIFFTRGIPFNRRRTKWNRFLNWSQLVKMLLIAILGMKRNLQARKVKVIEYFVEFIFDVFPPVEFLYLGMQLPFINKLYEDYCDRLNMRHENSSQLVRTVRKWNLVCVMITLFDSFLLYLFGLGNLGSSDNSVITNTFPFGSGPIDRYTTTTIAYIVFIYETLIKNYVPFSVSLYLAYYMILIAMKKKVLMNISRSTTCGSIYRQLEELELFMNQFESTLSILPFNWLAYNIGPGLCYLFTALAPVQDNLIPEQKIVFTFLTCWNLFLIVVAFYLISKWQEDVDTAIDSFRWRMEGSIQSFLHARMVDTVRSVIKRKVTVWHTLPIERVLILSYLGSALTFSVFLFQLSL